MNTKLAKIINEDALDCEVISITVNRLMATVNIHDDSGEKEDIFLQGEEGVKFINDFDTLTNKPELGEVLFENMIKHLAKPYAESLWN